MQLYLMFARNEKGDPTGSPFYIYDSNIRKFAAVNSVKCG